MGRNFKDVLKDIDEGKIKLTKEIGHVSYYLISKSSYMFHFYAVTLNLAGKRQLTELLYDLRDKSYFIKRNGKRLKFSIPNLDSVIPRESMGYSGFHDKNNRDEFFEMVSVEENKGMYKQMVKIIGAIGGETIDMTSRALIRLITEYNKLELIYKSGIVLPDHLSSLRKAVKDASRDDIRKVHKIFGITKSQFKFMKEFTRPDLLFHRLPDARGLSQEDMDNYRGYLEHIKNLDDKYNSDRFMDFNNCWSVLTYLSAVDTRNEEKNRRAEEQERGYGRRWYDNDIFSFIFEYNIPNPLRLIEYIVFECYFSQGMEMNSACNVYRDYYNMCKELNYTRFDKYPKYLKTCHDIVMRNYKVTENERLCEDFKKFTDEYKYLETVIEDYKIITPSEPEDLIYEGNILQHCVSSYVKKVAEGKTQIVFLRDKEKVDYPLVTVEIRNSRVVQAKGQANRPVTLQERQALRKFIKQKNLEGSY
ncbi:hypothetical protein BH753_gp090 [Bacillus phage Shbh1]|uniref:PcfJ-like protein n=1 Tax=Bacillus phage Shbh1 TaxID=1796992 RepID=A0A142F1B5_9CAUD|nr:hypothetical protein BH753_gp090 [Bacillus phage Shbh1]AMQ66572.1 hypothetical protein [Bacillus phage Shbh1]